MSQPEDHGTIMDTTSGSQDSHRELQPSLVATMWLQVLELYVCYYMLMYNIESDISQIHMPNSKNDHDPPLPPHSNTPVIGQAGILHVHMHYLHNTYMDNSLSCIITACRSCDTVYTTVNS